MELYDTVRIRDNGVIGTIVDISHRNGSVYYVVESSASGAVEGKDGGEWPLYDCREEDCDAIDSGSGSA